MLTMADFNYVFFNWLISEHDIQIRKLLSDIERLDRELACVRYTRALMNFMREQDYDRETISKLSSR